MKSDSGHLRWGLSVSWGQRFALALCARWALSVSHCHSTERGLRTCGAALPTGATFPPALSVLGIEATTVEVLLYCASTSPAALNTAPHSSIYHPKDCPGVTAQLSVFRGYKSEAPLGSPGTVSTPYSCGADAVSPAFFSSIHPVQSVFYFTRYLKISGPLLAPLFIFKQSYMFFANSKGTWGTRKVVTKFNPLSWSRNLGHFQRLCMWFLNIVLNQQRTCCQTENLVQLAASPP